MGNIVSHPDTKVDYSNTPPEERTKILFKLAMKSQWDQIVEICTENETARKAKITRAGDTALHIAVSDEQVEHAEKLVKHMSIDELAMKNDLGNTPLHIAASLGNVRMCECIAKDNPSLAVAANKESESPLFLAALHGRKDAFLCLHNIYTGSPNGKLESYCRRQDGNTILHCAISGSYFDLAFQIIHLYGDLVNSVNEQGVSPLHLLATKPSAFKTGSYLSLTDSIIYHTLYVDELKPQGPNTQRTFKQEKDPKYPENYRTCIDFIRFFWKVIRVVIFHPICKIADPETPVAPVRGGQGHQSSDSFPANYRTCVEFFILLHKAMLIVLGLGSTKIRKIRQKKENHKWSVQIMNEMLNRTSMYEYDEYSGMNPEPCKDKEEIHPYEIGDVIMERENIVDDNKEIKTDDKQKMVEGSSAPEATQKKTPKPKTETAILIAAKNGVTEMVEKILELFPVAIHDMNTEKKNIVLLAVENRQRHVYELLSKRKMLKDSVFKVDNEGNSALHLAAKLGKHENKPWLISGAALQMQLEIKWYQFVQNSVPPHFFAHTNIFGQTAHDIFTETHTEIIKTGGKWLTSTSQSCSVVAALIATVAFATASTVPGGTKDDSGIPTLENQPAFDVFAIASLVALCFSVTAMVMFLSILTSRHEEKDFGKDLPRKLLVGMTSLFVSIASILVSFCAGHFFVLRDKLKYAAFPVYAIACLPVTIFAVVQLPLYADLVWAHFKKLPRRRFKTAPL